MSLPRQLKNCSFTGNSARGGRGGTVLLEFAVKSNRRKDEIEILGTGFVNNSAMVGDAVDFFTTSHNERVHCSWTVNTIVAGP